MYGITFSQRTEKTPVTKFRRKAIFYNMNVFLTHVIIRREVNYYNYYSVTKEPMWVLRVFFGGGGEVEQRTRMDLLQLQGSFILSVMAKHIRSCSLPSSFPAPIFHSINVRKKFSLPQSYFTTITLQIWHK